MRAHSAVSYAEAVATIARYSARLHASAEPQQVEMLDALGRVLASPVLADRDQPSFRRATRDGFACRAEDLASGGPLHLIGLVRAGEVWPGPDLAPGQTIEIMTGAPLPAAANAVVMIEHIERSASERGEQIELLAGRRLAPGDNFIPQGAEAQAGATLVSAGTRLRPAHVAAAASAGATRLTVHRRPRVAILSTGDELVPIHAQPLPFKIRNSNSYSLAAQVLGAGGEPMILPVAGDTARALEQAVRTAIEGADLLLLSGGVSMGKYDLVEDVLAVLGAEFFFTGVHIQPGKPVVFGEMPAGADSIPFFGLPGNPVSTLVTFALFAAPVLAALGGERLHTPRFAEARLTAPALPTPNLRRFLPAHLNSDADGALVTPVPWQGSGDVAGTTQANCFLVIPEAENTDALPKGATVRVLLG